MDIRQAKQQIKNATLAYFSKDEFGNYRLPTGTAAPRVPAGRARHREDGHHGADRPGPRRGVRVVFDDAPHAPKRARLCRSSRRRRTTAWEYDVSGNTR